MSDDALACVHEAAHAVVAQQYGFDVRHVQVHRDGGGCCETRQWIEEVDADPTACLVYLFAGGAAARRVGGQKAVGDEQDRSQALAIASVMHGFADASDPRVVATLRAAEALANALILNPTTWSAIERTARALRRRKRLTGRDIHELREARR